MNIQHYNPRFRTNSGVIHVSDNELAPLCGASKSLRDEWRPIGLRPTCQLCIKRARNLSLEGTTPRPKAKSLPLEKALGEVTN